MSVRSRIADAPVLAAKAFGGSVPESFQQGEQAAQMTPASPFSPGQPIGPYDGYDRTPRVQDFVTGRNIATRPRTHERVSFDTLRGLIEAYDVAQLCIWHKIDTLRGVRWKLLAADNYNGDVAGAAELGKKVMSRPDGIHNFRTWFGKWFYDVLAYDAAPLYRLRNRGGRVVGLMPFDGCTLAPLLDYWGNPPAAPAEAYVQYVNGLPWNWLTRDDVIYEPFRAVNSSPYGKAPIESIIINSNTDMRFQLRFLQQFTDGNIPAGLASAPESWSPEQIEQWQVLWDSFMYGDQSRKSQIRWMPGGSTIAWSNEKDFTDAFSLFLMRKTLAAYHCVATDLGFTESSNYSTGESQADVAHKVGELPPMEYAEEIISRFLYDDMGLPLKFEFDRGEDQDDRLTQAQADQIYIEEAVVSASEIRELRFGLPEPEGQTVPRIFMTTRAGPVPLASLMGVAGKIDPETGAPDPRTPLPHEAFVEVPGVVPNPPLTEAPLAEEEYGPSAIPPAPPMQPAGVPVATDPNAPTVAKEAAGSSSAGATGDGSSGTGPSVGITSDTGLYGYDGPGHRDDEDDHISEDEARVALAKAEAAAFSRFSRSRRKAGAWRDFEFAAVSAVEAHRLNDGGRLAVRKAAGEIAVAGLAVLAADTGRVLMLQRALCDDDPAGGTWEFAGGHIEGDETPMQAAWREWAEETSCIPPPGALAGTWTSGNGIYQGFVWRVDSESCVPVRADGLVANPDDPDGDQREAIAWWTPADLPSNPALRPELLADIDAVMDALGCGQDDCCGAECCSGGCCNGSCGCTCGPGDVAKAGDPQDPKGGSGGQPPPVQSAWPGWDYDLQAAAYWAPLLAAAFLGGEDPEGLATAWLKLAPVSDASTKPDRLAELTAQAKAWLAKRGTDLGSAISDTIRGVLTDGYAIGAASADAAAAAAEGAQAAEHLGSIAADMGDWAPGASSVARELAGNLGAGDGLSDLLRQADVKIKSIAETRLADLAKVLADGAERGLSQDEMADAIKGMLSDPSRARMIVATELARAANNAAAWSYRLHGVEQVIWVTAEDASVCPDCDANEAAGPRPINDGPQPPGHPLCRCALIPAPA